MIVIIGSVNMDLVLRVPRMPLPGETLAGDKFMTIPGGKGANQAVACARLAAPGTCVAMVACVGDDAFGGQMRNSITACGIDDRYIDEVAGEATGIASIMVDANAQNSIVIAAGASPFVPPIPGLKEAGYLTSDTVWGLTELPKRLVVLGGGPCTEQIDEQYTGQCAQREAGAG